MADTTVKLAVKKGALPEPPDGWKKCKDGDGTEIDFHCKYTGGNTAADDGSWEFDHDDTGNSGKNIQVQLDDTDIWHGPKGNGFKITDIEITYDGNPPDKDLSVQGEGPTHRTIKNANKHAQEGDFTVVVAHRDADGTVVEDIHCDPGWKNN